MLRNPFAISKNPRDVAYSECVEIIKTSNFPLSFEEIVKSVCERNAHVKHYLGEHTIYKLRDHKKIRPILDLLIKHSSIKQIQQNPIVLQWFDASTIIDGISSCNNNKQHNNNNNECDSCDPCDLIKIGSTCKNEKIILMSLEYLLLLVLQPIM
jgi:hypothetical protein